jgi:uncharacterized protein with WD repeat
MKLKTGPMAAAVMAFATLGVVALAAPAQAGATSGNKNCTLYAMTASQGKIQCYTDSWRARAKVDCYKITNGAYSSSPTGIYIDAGISTAYCPSGTEVGDVYAQYNQSITVKLT